MNKIYLRNIVIISIFCFTLTSAVMNQSGPSAGLTNAPGEGNCTNCHSGSLVTSGTNHNNIFLSTGFQGNGYVPDSTYTMSLSFKQSGISRYGFQITCLTSTGNLPVGTFTAVNSRVQKMTAVIGGNTRQYIGHTNTGSDTVKKDSTRWIFTWKAPASNIGKVKFYALVNATNRNGSDNGDICYAKTFEFGASSLLPVADATSIDSVTCTNYIAQMSGKGTNSPTTYNWKFINATPTSSTLQNPTVKFTAPGTQLAILTVKNTLGTSFPDTLKVIVKPSPNASILTGSSGTICQGDSIQLAANTGANIAYKWNPNNKTTRTVFVKDSGIYSVTVTSTTNSCATTSANYKLNWYTKPTLSLSKSLSTDTFCGQINETFTASGTNLDSIYWYVNNSLYAITKSLSLPYTGKSNINIYALGKSLNRCFSQKSNNFNLIITPKIYPSNFSDTRTTSTIDLKWIKTSGLDSIQYSLINTQFFRTDTDTSLSLTGLQPSTFYNIRLRSFQKGVCKFTDTILSIRTNNCSNITYKINMKSNICKGETLTAFIADLPKTKASVSFDNQPFSNDTSYSFIPVVSDSLIILIKDSLSLTCPPISEKRAYIVDTFPIDNGIYNVNIASCSNSYTYSINPLYQKYEFFKNNISMYSGVNNQYQYTGLITGDQLTTNVSINSCSKTLGTSNFTLLPPSDATFTYSRDWKTYTFKPNDTDNVNFSWYFDDSLIANSNKLIMDMSKYSKQSVKIKLKTINFPGCSDSSEQIVTFPDFLSITDLSNYRLNIYPNPFNENIQIITNLDEYALKIYDNLGRIIFEANDLNYNYSIKTTDWTNGLYHIVLSNEKLKLDKILIKLN